MREIEMKMEKGTRIRLPESGQLLLRVDAAPLWWIGILMLGIILLPNLTLGEGSVFVIHDQLDESMMNYVLTARHMGQGTIPEMLGGINASGLQPASVLFAFFYLFLTPFHAFLCSYVIVFLVAFQGMYLAVKELTDSSLLSVFSAGLFSMLPFYTVYGLSQAGIPLMLYAFCCLYRQKNKVGALCAIALFALTSHLVYTGYGVLLFWGVALIILWARRRGNPWLIVGFAELLGLFLATNYQLLLEVLFGKGAFVSHRGELLNSGMPFWKAVKELFIDGHYHAQSFHSNLILPVLLLLLSGLVCYKWLCKEARQSWWLALGTMGFLVATALFYGVCKSDAAAAFRNQMSGFLHSFQIDRFYWFYPAGWYLELALVLSVWWREGKSRLAGRKSNWVLGGFLLYGLLGIVFTYPTADQILKNSTFYQNVNQYNNGSGITGYISWESYYSEDLMQQLEDAIGRDMGEYRVAHLGISPAPSLMHGFYTVDGYSNNYPLEYKHAFRRVIAAELQKVPETEVYFDKWGNRCYLFNSQTGNYWMLQKGNDVVYEGLEFDMDALRELGCEYLFSGAEIVDAERMGLTPMGYFATKNSYWGVWLYAFQ